MRVNLEAAEEVGRQLRLRGIGGAIVIDFIRMRRRENADRVVEALRDALRDDPVPTDVGALSRFGLLEMTRRRSGPALSEIVGRTCPVCEGLGFVDTAETAADHILATAEREAEENPGGFLTIFAAPDADLDPRADRRCGRSPPASGLRGRVPPGRGVRGPTVSMSYAAARTPRLGARAGRP